FLSKSLRRRRGGHEDVGINREDDTGKVVAHFSFRGHYERAGRRNIRGERVAIVVDKERIAREDTGVNEATGAQRTERDDQLGTRLDDEGSTKDFLPAVLDPEVKLLRAHREVANHATALTAFGNAGVERDESQVVGGSSEL